MAHRPDKAGLRLEAQPGGLIEVLDQVKAFDHHIGPVYGVVEIGVESA